MNILHIGQRSAIQALVSLKLSTVLAVIAIACGLLAYEWHRADSAKMQHTSAHRHPDRDLGTPTRTEPNH